MYSQISKSSYCPEIMSELVLTKISWEIFLNICHDKENSLIMALKKNLYGTK